MSFLPPNRLFSLAPFWQWNGTGRRWYDLAPDDQRFLMIEKFGADRITDRLVFVSHLRDDVARRLPR